MHIQNFFLPSHRFSKFNFGALHRWIECVRVGVKPPSVLVVQLVKNSSLQLVRSRTNETSRCPYKTHTGPSILADLPATIKASPRIIDQSCTLLSASELQKTVTGHPWSDRYFTRSSIWSIQRSTLSGRIRQRPTTPSRHKMGAGPHQPIPPSTPSPIVHRFWTMPALRKPTARED